MSRNAPSSWATALSLAVCLCGAGPAIAQRSTPIQLQHPQGAASDSFGRAVAVSGDTMIVGAPFDDAGANANQGSAHVFHWTGSGWALEATLMSTDGAANDEFGYSVAISGDTAVVGAHLDDVGPNGNQGSAYVFTRTGSSWIQQAKLSAADGATDDEFGTAVAISGDTVMIGAYHDDVGASPNQGSVYVFTRSGSLWNQQAQLVAADGATGDSFGEAIALSDMTVVIGAYGDDIGSSNNQGSAYVYFRTDGATWTQQAKLIADDGRAADFFGYSVALSGDSAVIGAHLHTVGIQSRQGAAYVFTRADGIWIQQARLSATGGNMDDSFGYSVAISGDTVLVGVPGDDHPSFAGNEGTASVFTRSGSVWTERGRFSAADAAAGDSFGISVALWGDSAVIAASADDVGTNINQGSVWAYARLDSTWIGPNVPLVDPEGFANDQFGYGVAIWGDTAVIGAPLADYAATTDEGSIYACKRSGSIWFRDQLFITTGGLNDHFGSSVAVSGGTIIGGSPLDDVGARINQGSAHVFSRAEIGWRDEGMLSPADGASQDNFGISVAISGDTAVVGAYNDDVGANTNQGSAYVFTRSGFTWTQQAQLLALDGAAQDNFGCSVAISGDTIVVGALNDDVGARTNQGSAYVFTRTGSIWTQQAQLTAVGGATADSFGCSVALSGDTALIGAYLRDVSDSGDPGSAYVFTRSGSSWTQQAQLAASDGADEDRFGYSVALWGDTAVIGAPFDDIGANVDQGSSYLFTRLGIVWTEQTRFTAADGAAGDRFGSSVAVQGNTAVVGAYLHDRNGSADQGSAWIFDVPLNDFSSAHNDSVEATYPTVAAAFVTAQSGHQISATDAAWRDIDALDTSGRTLDLRSQVNLRTPSTSTLTLDGASSLNVPAGKSISIYGQFRAGEASSTTVAADQFFLGSRGTLTAQTGSSITISSPIVNLVGQTNLEPGARIAIGGDTLVFGPVLASLDSELVIGGSFDCSLNLNTRYDMSQALIQLESTGGGAEHTLEVMSADIGADLLGLDRVHPGHYPIGTLHIGPSPSVVRLIDARDNDGQGQDLCEAIYVDELRIDAGSRLINPTCRIYYNILMTEGVVDVPENLISLLPPCEPGDVDCDGDVDLPDLAVLLSAFDSCSDDPGFIPAADLDGDGCVELGDLAVLLWNFGRT